MRLIMRKIAINQNRKGEKATKRCQHCFEIAQCSFHLSLPFQSPGFESKGTQFYIFYFIIEFYH